MTRLRTILVAVSISACGGGDPIAIDAPVSPPDGRLDTGLAPADADTPPPPPDAAPPAPDANPNAITLDNIDDLTESAVCDWWIRCSLVPDLLACANAFHIEAGTLPQLVAYAAEGRVFFDADAAASCLDALATVPCTYDSGLPEVCGEVFTGPVGDGGLCVVNEECVGDATCVQPACEGECCTGQCTPPLPESSVGEDCSGNPCDDASWCDGAICQPRAAVGQPCTSFDGCVAGAFCRPDGTCGALVDEGAPCDPTIFAPSGGCARYDNWCNPATSTCETRLEAGESCLDAPVDPCLPYAVCDGSACDARPYAGQPCGGFSGACLGDAICETGTCVPPEPAEVCP